VRMIRTSRTDPTSSVDSLRAVWLMNAIEEEEEIVTSGEDNTTR